MRCAEHRTISLEPVVNQRASQRPPSGAFLIGESDHKSSAVHLAPHPDLMELRRWLVQAYNQV